MSGGSNKAFKQFPINCKEDACFVLGSLISAVIVHLEKYKEYTTEALCLLGKADSEYISAKSYDDINDKLLYRQREILRYTADCQDSSFSYFNLRKILIKKGYLSEQLSPDTKEILSEFLDLRNWSFHNPQSLMVAYKESEEKSLPEYLKGKVKISHMLNPVITNIVDKFEIEVLLSLTHHTRNKIEQFEKVLNSMKNDYEILYYSLENIPYNVTSSGLSKKVEYINRPVTSKLTDIGSDVTQISMAIQKSKYDGTDESFNKWVIRSNSENNK
jgi:hypothetical protein